MSKMPKQKPGKSIQDVGTDPRLIKAIELRFGKIECDLAATPDNTIAKFFITPEIDSLKQEWATHWGPGLCFLNPPFGDIGPWAEKCALESSLGARILLLTPLTSARWMQKHIWGKAHIMMLATRLTFRGHKIAYPKDTMLSYYHHGIAGVSIWDWQATLNNHERKSIQKLDPG